MNITDQGWVSEHLTRCHGASTARCVFVLLLVSLAGGSLALAHSPNVDASLADWCVGAPSNGVGGNRVEDSAATLECGNCSGATGQACEVNADCPGGQTCVNLTSKQEVAWWDNRTDGAVNDLGTVAITTDNTNLYVAAELWVDPDPVSLPFGQIAIDWTQGGVSGWHDPKGVITRPGRCSGDPTRGCSGQVVGVDPPNPDDINGDGILDADCFFCAISEEPFPSTRKRACGSGCDPDVPGDICERTQSCEIAFDDAGLVGTWSSPEGRADYLLAFDFSFWLTGVEDENSVLVLEPGTAQIPTSPWDWRMGCAPDFDGDGNECDFVPAVNPGASGGSGGPPGSVEVAIPWCAFGCTGCPELTPGSGLDACGNPSGAGCVCAGFGPGKDFRFSMMVARGRTDFDFAPDASIEDTMSEVALGTTTTTTDSCGGSGTPPGLDATMCELADRSTDAYIPRTPTLPHEAAPGGRAVCLSVTKNLAPSITLDWFASCSVADTDYEVYEGTIGNWYSHQPVSCATGGTTATFNAGAGDRYYLVVPTNGATEGSYGPDSAGFERPVSTGQCFVQSLGSCP